MRTYNVLMTIRAECVADAVELINDYTGEETAVSILVVTPYKCQRMAMLNAVAEPSEYEVFKAPKSETKNRR